MLQNPKTQTAEKPDDDDNRVELRDEDTLCQMSGFSETGSQVEDSQYILFRTILNDFLYDTFGRARIIKDFIFLMLKKSVTKLQHSVGLNVLNE